MEMTKQLTRLLKGFYIALLISFAISALLVVFFAIFKGNNPFTTEGAKNETIQWLDVSWSLYSVIFSGFFAFGILQLKKGISNISGNNYFTSEIIHHFKKAGNTFVSLGIVLLIFHIVTQLYFNSGIFFIIDTILFCYLFILIIGIFFKLFGNIFIHGKALREENDLTI